MPSWCVASVAAMILQLIIPLASASCPLVQGADAQHQVVPADDRISLLQTALEMESGSVPSGFFEDATETVQGAGVAPFDVGFGDVVPMHPEEYSRPMALSQDMAKNVVLFKASQWDRSRLPSQRPLPRPTSQPRRGHEDSASKRRATAAATFKRPRSQLQQWQRQLSGPRPVVDAAAKVEKAVELNLPPADPLPLSDFPLQLPQTTADIEQASQASADYIARLEDAGGKEEPHERPPRSQRHLFDPLPNASPPPLALLGSTVSEGHVPTSGGHSLSGDAYFSGAGEDGEEMTPYSGPGLPPAYDPPEARVVLNDAKEGQFHGHVAPAHGDAGPDAPGYGWGALQLRLWQSPPHDSGVPQRHERGAPVDRAEP